ncbi:Transcriptional adapter 2-beta [Blomia tropicalis]|nr:Transcriptional adapter 2-beta [Blomia tropicalis]
MSVLKSYYCCNCLDEIKEVLFTCDVCDQFDLCLQCTICGVEIGKHECTHPFRMLDLGTFSIFNSRYTNDDDNKKIQLPTNEFEVINVGNVVSNTKQSEIISPLKIKIGKSSVNKGTGHGKGSNKKSKIEIKESVETLPTESIEEKKSSCDNYDWDTNFEWNDCSLEYFSDNEGNGSDDDSKYEFEPDHKIYYSLENGKLKRTFTEKVIKNKRSQEKNEDEVGIKLEDIIGYMPMRNDFEREFDNDAETLIANLVCSPNEVERRYSLAQISLYQLRLIERFRNKAVIRRFGLVQKFIRNHRTALSAQQLAEAAAVAKAKKLASEAGTSHSSSHSVESIASNIYSSEPKKFNLEMKKLTREEEFSSLFSPWLYHFTRIELQDNYFHLLYEVLLKSTIYKLVKYHNVGITKLSEIQEIESNIKNSHKKRKVGEEDNITTEAIKYKSNDRETIDEQSLSKYKSISNDSLDNLTAFNRKIDKDNLIKVLAIFRSDKLLLSILENTYPLLFPELEEVLNPTSEGKHTSPKKRV